MKKYLVTGGAGFLGSHIVESLLQNGDEVIVLDNFFTGAESNLASIVNRKSIKLVKGDVCIPFEFEVDGILNLACPASPVHYQSNPVQTIRTSVLGAINSLDLAMKLNCKVLQTSTSEVYGDPEISPQKEEYRGSVNPIGIRACYDEGKRAAETLFFDYNRQYGTQIKVARIFNTYGPRMDLNDGRVVSNFIVQALRNEPITLYGEGNQTRSFCYVSDLIEGLLSLFFSAEDVIGPINLGNPNEFTIMELAEIIIRKTKSKSKIISLPLPEDDPRQRRPDINLALKTLNWKPKIELEEGLDLTIQEFKTRMF